MFLFRTLLSFFKDEIYRELLITIFVLIVLGTVFFHFSEGWNWLDSLYFCIATVTTTGYGDIYPKSDIGKVFNIFYLLISLVMILMLIDTMNQHYNDRKEIKDQKESRHKTMVRRTIRKRNKEKL